MAKRILLVDADSKIPNIALGKLSYYHKDKGNSVDFIKLNLSYFPNRINTPQYLPTNQYDEVFCSVVFEGTKQFIHGENIVFGGTGYNFSTSLPKEIEYCPVDYSLWPDNDISYGFITRGCIHNCNFCVVPKKEGYIHQVNTIDEIVRHKKVKFLDNNILSFPDHIQILKELISKNIKCSFNQGLDIRLLDNHNSKLLSLLNYYPTEYFFAFDDVKYLKLISKQLPLLSWRKPWQIKFFMYTHPNMPFSSITTRLNFLKENQCLPYIMRDISCWKSPYKNFYTDIAAWANQPGFFKNYSFKRFLEERHPRNPQRVSNSLNCFSNKPPVVNSLLF